MTNQFQITKISLHQAYLFSEVRPPEIWGTCYKFYLLTISLNACHDHMDSAAEKIAYIYNMKVTFSKMNSEMKHGGSRKPRELFA